MVDSTTRHSTDLDLSCLQLEAQLLKIKTHRELIVQRFLIFGNFCVILDSGSIFLACISYSRGAHTYVFGADTRMSDVC